MPPVRLKEWWRFSWLRGSASYDAGWIRLDRKRAEEYLPKPEDQILDDLMAVREPAEAVAFVQRYGLLHHGPGVAEFRERFRDWELKIKHIRYAAHVYLLVRRAASEGDQQALAELREHWEPNIIRPLYGDPPPADDADILGLASMFVASMVSLGLRGVEEGLGTTVGEYTPMAAPQRFFLQPRPADLLGHAYHQLAVRIVGQVPISECAECSRLFVVEDRRQRFCSKTCGNRARYRRWRSGGKRDGKARK